jgi:hypothetical protein
MLCSQSAAEAILEPHLDLLSGVFPVAWEEWERFGEVAPQQRIQVCRRTRASMLSNFAATAAELRLGQLSPEVVLTDRPGFLLLVFNSELHVRLKKYRGSSTQTSGIPTTQRQMFQLQQPITGMPEATNLVLGYRLKEDASGIESTSITCSTGTRLHWEIDLPFGGEGQVLEFRPKPSGPLPEAGAPEPGISSTLLAPEENENENENEGGVGD